jgi:hypothetical protein
MYDPIIGVNPGGKWSLNYCNLPIWDRNFTPDVGGNLVVSSRIVKGKIFNGHG